MKPFLIVVLVALFSLPLQAKSVDDLYDAKVMVLDQSQASRLAGARLGLLEVLQKISGFSVPQDQPVINKAWSIADQYLYQFSYTTLEINENPKGVKGALWLTMRFEGKAIQRLIKQAKLPRWGKNRPSILVWLAVDDGQERQIVSDGLGTPAFNSLQDGGKRRGLPLIYPVYDLEDSLLLPIEQLWGMFDEAILAASQRYGAESVLAARVFKTAEGKWKGQWRFYFRSIEQSFVFETLGFEQQILEGLSASAQILANSFALKPSSVEANALSIEVAGVKSLTDYARLTQYLQKLAITKQVAIRKLSKDKILMDLILNGSVEQLKQTLALDRKLAPSGTASTGLASTEVEYFTWDL